MVLVKGLLPLCEAAVVHAIGSVSCCQRVSLAFEAGVHIARGVWCPCVSADVEDSDSLPVPFGDVVQEVLVLTSQTELS